MCTSDFWPNWTRIKKLKESVDRLPPSCSVCCVYCIYCVYCVLLYLQCLQCWQCLLWSCARRWFIKLGSLPPCLPALGKWNRVGVRVTSDLCQSLAKCPSPPTHTRQNQTRKTRMRKHCNKVSKERFYGFCFLSFCSKFKYILMSIFTEMLFEVVARWKRLDLEENTSEASVEIWNLLHIATVSAITT